jgi:hypothetical protein
MTEQILSSAKTNFDIHLNNAITKKLCVKNESMKHNQIESYDDLLFGE